MREFGRDGSPRRHLHGIAERYGCEVHWKVIPCFQQQQQHFYRWGRLARDRWRDSQRVRPAITRVLPDAIGLVDCTCASEYAEKPQSECKQALQWRSSSSPSTSASGRGRSRRVAWRGSNGWADGKQSRHAITHAVDAREQWTRRSWIGQCLSYSVFHPLARWSLSDQFAGPALDNHKKLPRCGDRFLVTKVRTLHEV